MAEETSRGSPAHVFDLARAASKLGEGQETERRRQHVSALRDRVMRQRALEDLSPEALAALADKLTVIERKFRDLSDMVADLLIQLEVATPPPEEADLSSLDAEIPSSEPGFAPVPPVDPEVEPPQPTPPDETPPGLTESETTESTAKLSEKWRLRVRW